MGDTLFESIDFPADLPLMDSANQTRDTEDLPEWVIPVQLLQH